VCALREDTEDSERYCGFVVADKETAPPMELRGVQPHRGFGKPLEQGDAARHPKLLSYLVALFNGH